VTLPEIDLRQHILFIAFKNTHIDSEYPTTTQSMAADLLVNYSHIFPNTTKIFYTIKLLKHEGLVTESMKFDKKEFERCMQTMQQQHRRMAPEKMEQKCRELAGVKGVLQITEPGTVEFCGKTMKYLVKPRAISKPADGPGAKPNTIVEPVTKTNRIIYDVCKTYKTEP
jgi:hypothetical protein